MLFLVVCSEFQYKEETMLSSEEQLKQIINYNDLPQPPTFIKPGFYFNVRDYPLLQSLKMTRDRLSLLEKDVVMQHIALEGNETELFLYFIANSISSQKAREKTISFAASMTSMMMDAFTSGPPDVGEFNIVTQHPSGKIIDMVHFVRNNIGVTVFLRGGEFEVASLARQIDENIQGMKDYDRKTIKSISPQINRITQSEKKILLNSTFEISIVVDQKHTTNDLLYIVGYDEDKINLEEDDGPQATFTALEIGETVINCTVVDRKTLLSTSDSIKINIFEK